MENNNQSVTAKEGADLGKTLGHEVSSRYGAILGGMIGGCITAPLLFRAVTKILSNGVTSSSLIASGALGGSILLGVTSAAFLSGGFVGSVVGSNYYKKKGEELALAGKTKQEIIDAIDKHSGSFTPSLITVAIPIMTASILWSYYNYNNVEELRIQHSEESTQIELIALESGLENIPV